MKKIIVTYDVLYNDEKAETCTALEVAEERISELYSRSGSEGISTMLENLFDMTEFFKARQYIWGSVKTIEEV